MYDHGEYMTVSMQHLAGTPTTIQYRQEQLDTLYAEVAPENQSSHAISFLPCQLSDAEVLKKARSAMSGLKFSML
jgi:hypothetical protein